jgi:creatinine amidohydrolase
MHVQLEGTEMAEDHLRPLIGEGTLEYEWMTWPEIKAATGLPVVVAVGSTEQHGPHLPVSADWAIPQAMLRAAQSVRPFVLGPALRLGYRSRPASGGGQQFPGTLSLRATTFMAVIEDLLDELIRTGFTKIVIYNWHFENANFVYEPAFLVSGRHPGVKILVVENGLPDFSQEDLRTLFPDGFPGLALEHAAVIETSLFEYLCPATVRMDKIGTDSPARQAPYDILPIDPSLSTASGSLSDAKPASADKGKLLTSRIVDYVTGIIDAEFPLEGGS